MCLRVFEFRLGFLLGMLRELSSLLIVLWDILRVLGSTQSALDYIEAYWKHVGYAGIALAFFAIESILVGLLWEYFGEY